MSLRAIKTALLSILGEGGLAVREAFPAGEMTRLTEPVTALSLQLAQAENAAFCHYLGQRWNESAQEWEELYGKQVKATFALDIFVPGEDARGGAACQAVFDEIAGRLLCAAPMGLRIGAFSCGAVTFDKTVNAFRCRAEAECTAYLCAAAAEDGGTLLDFQLRGVMQA